MKDTNENLTWTPEDAQGDEFGKDGHCPYWKCSQDVTFVGEMGRDDDGNIMDVRYTCEQCGRTHEWAQETQSQQANDGLEAQTSAEQLYCGSSKNCI